jgi:hypothetical protein
VKTVGSNSGWWEARRPVQASQLKSADTIQTRWFITSGTFIWLALVLSFFIPVKSTFRHPGDDVLPELTRLVLTYLAVSFVILLSLFAFGKGLQLHFVHFQAMAALVPLTYLCTASAFLSYATLRLGYFPQPNRPDPATIGLGLVEFHIGWYVLLAGALVAYVLLYRLRLVDWPSFGLRLLGLLSFTGIWLALWAIAKYDVLYFIQWLGD